MLKRAIEAPKAPAPIADKTKTEAQESVAGASTSLSHYEFSPLSAEARTRILRFQRNIKNCKSDKSFNDMITVLKKELKQDEIYIKQFSGIQALNLDVIWNHIIDMLDKILYVEKNQLDQEKIEVHKNNLYEFFKSIIKIVQVPEAFELFFLSEKESEVAFLVLHPSLQEKVRVTIIHEIDELLINANVNDFFEKSPFSDNGFYNLVNEIISQISELYKKRRIIIRAHKKNTESSAYHGNNIKLLSEMKETFSDIISLQEQNGNEEAAQITRTLSNNFQQASEITRYAQQYNIPIGIEVEPISEEPVEREEKPERNALFLTQLSDSIQPAQYCKKLHHDSSLQRHYRGKMENTVLSLSEGLLKEIEAYEIELTMYALFSHNENAEGDFDPSGLWQERKKNLFELRRLHTEQQLTPRAFNRIFSASKEPIYNYLFYQDSGPELFKKIRKYLIIQLAEMESAAERNVTLITYKITDTNLISRMRSKLKSFDDVPDGYEYVKRESKNKKQENNQWLWRLEKYSALHYLQTKHEETELTLIDFLHVKKMYPLFNVRFFPAFRGSVTEDIINEWEEHVREALWIDAGGEGPEPQHELRNKLALT